MNACCVFFCIAYVFVVVNVCSLPAFFNHGVTTRTSICPARFYVILEGTCVESLDICCSK